MSIKKMYIVLIMMGVAVSSCESYGDLIEDFDYTTVYFSSQKPLRSIVSYDEMQFKVGVALGGKRENNIDEYADFEIDESLLTSVSGADAFTLLPEAYYELSNTSTMVISSGSFIGDVTVTLNRDLFTNDPLAVQNTYALPLKITNSSLDSIGGFNPDGSILDIPKDYTILVVKYISQYTGIYYYTSIQNEVDDTGVILEQIIYNEDNLTDVRRELTTVDRNSVLIPSGIGSISDENFVINIDETDNSIVLDSPSSGISNFVGTGIVNEDRSMTLSYSYTIDSKNYEVEDTLTLHRPVEEELGFEEW
ncbi:DUF1735 domain-containing protein [Flavicella sp.]|uniref:DUF1735 domain-containing protein n=1 Tax=Flavicella sp. TaxID=2957742 RepID=UPI0030174EDB